MATRSGTCSYFEAKPGGDAAFSWCVAACNGDYVLAGIWSGALYLSTDRGATWNQQYPEGGGGSGYWLSAAISDGGTVIVSSISGTFLKLSGTWSELKPDGSTSFPANGVNISRDGTRYLVGGKYGGSGRLWSYYDGTWTEERPAGDIDCAWRIGRILNNGNIIVPRRSGYVYLKSSGSWSSINPTGASTKSWMAADMSEDGTKRYAVDNYYAAAYAYMDGAWLPIKPLPEYGVYGISLLYVNCGCSSDGDKVIMTRTAWGGFLNMAMSELHSQHNWPGLVGSRDGSCYGGISSDGTLACVSHFGGRLYVYDKDDLPEQIEGGYRKEFTYTHAAGARSNFKVRVRVYNKHTNTEYLHCEGRANDDFSDIYFKNAAGDTLRHCIVADEMNCSSLDAGYYRYVWVELDQVGTSPATFYMHYGDSGHSDSSTAPASFFDQYDDFERGADGDAVGGVWTVTSGTVKITTACALKGTRSGNWVGASTKAKANIPATAGDENYIGFWIYKQSNSAAMFAAHGDGNTYARWEFGANQTVKNYTGGAYEASLVTESGQVWRPFEMCGFDWTGDTYDLFTNFTNRGNDLNMQASAGYTNILQVENTTNYVVYIDSLVICYSCNAFATPDSESIGSEEEIGESVYSGPAGVKTWNDIPSANIKTWNDIPWNTIKAMN